MKKRVFVILTYDVNQKRVGKVCKVCKKYLHHVQKSVFEGEITEARLKQLKREVETIVYTKEDALCIYRLDSVKYASKEQIGMVNSISNIIWREMVCLHLTRFYPKAIKKRCI